MQKSIVVYHPYNMFALTFHYSKNFTTNVLLTKEHMTMFVIKYCHILNYGKVMGHLTRITNK